MPFDTRQMGETSLASVKTLESGRAAVDRRALKKRLFDLAVSILVAPFVGVTVLGLGLLIRLVDGQPVIFAHTRIGRNGRTFRCLKLRTMAPDAEARLAGILASDPEAAQQWAASQKLKHDPRVTPLGRILRKTSLDELPQLWNVLRGDMSLVGPRPIVEDEIPRYGDSFAAYASVRPGVTGPWQVAGRNDLTYAERVRLDQDYAANWSLVGDMVLIVKTAWAVIRFKGAF